MLKKRSADKLKKLDIIDNVNMEKIYNQIVILIEDAKRNVAIRVNNEITILYWNIGKEIAENVLNYEKAEYGKSVIKNLSNRLTIKYGKGYSVANIFRMLKSSNF